MIEKIKQIVEEACQKETNHFGYSIWSHHILSVIEYAKILAEKFNADAEIVEIAALLHDYAGIKDYKFYDEHHIHSSNEAERILQDFNYPQDRIEQIKHCILTHRGSRNFFKETIEAEILASADSMAHFANVNSLLYLVFVERKMSLDEGTEWILNKLERSWKKLMPEAREIIKAKYEAIKEVLSTSKV